MARKLSRKYIQNLHLKMLQLPCQAAWIFFQLQQTVIVYLTWILIVVRLLAHFHQLQFSFWQFHIHHLKFLSAATLFTFFPLGHNRLYMTILLFLHYEDDRSFLHFLNSVEQIGAVCSKNDLEPLSFTISIIQSVMEEKSSVTQDKNERFCVAAE